MPTIKQENGIKAWLIHRLGGNTFNEIRALMSSSIADVVTRLTGGAGCVKRTRVYKNERGNYTLEVNIGIPKAKKNGKH